MSIAKNDLDKVLKFFKNFGICDECIIKLRHSVEVDDIYNLSIMCEACISKHDDLTKMFGIKPVVKK